MNLLKKEHFELLQSCGIDINLCCDFNHTIIESIKTDDCIINQEQFYIKNVFNIKFGMPQELLQKTKK